MKSNAKSVFKKLERKFDRVKSDATRVLANEGVKVFLSNFKTESFEGDKWQEVQRRQPGTSPFNYPKKRDLNRRSRPILIGKTRKLRNATASSIRYVGKNKIVWGNYLPYAAIQNENRPFMKVGRKFTRTLKMKLTSMFRQVK